MIAHENSVVDFDEYCFSVAFRMAVGTGYSAIKLPLVSLTLRVTPRLIFCLRPQLETESSEVW